MEWESVEQGAGQPDAGLGLLSLRQRPEPQGSSFHGGAPTPSPGCSLDSDSSSAGKAAAKQGHLLGRGPLEHRHPTGQGDNEVALWRGDVDQQWN